MKKRGLETGIGNKTEQREVFNKVTIYIEHCSTVSLMAWEFVGVSFASAFE